MHRIIDASGENAGARIEQLMETAENDFDKAMDDDLSINAALATLFDFVREVNNLLDDNMINRKEAQQVQDLMIRFDKVLGVIGEIERTERLSKEAEELIKKREEARKTKDWKTADKIREQLKTLGITIEDTDQGVKWRTQKR
jgi:cysteinyl-tRNA synthetase